MSKKFQREEKQLDRLQRELRELKSQNRVLLRKLREANKGYYKFMLADTHELEETAVQEAKKIARKVCWDCHVGSLQRIDIGNRYFYQCDSCFKTTPTKPVK